MNEPIIGIISSRKVDKENVFKNQTCFNNNYFKMVVLSGGIPLGIVFPDGKFIEEELEICDGFIFQGGSIIESCQLEAMDYAIKNKKPILGICLGMQTMVAYEWFKNNFDEDAKYLIEYENKFLSKVDGHNNVDPFMISDIDKSKHEVFLDKNSILYNIYNDEIINVPSVHNYSVNKNVFDSSRFFKITGKSSDKIVEVIESRDPNYWAVGVQFHPELEEYNLKLFKEFVSQCKKRQFDNK